MCTCTCLSVRLHVRVRVSSITQTTDCEYTLRPTITPHALHSPPLLHRHPSPFSTATQVGYTQNAFIVNCGGDYKDSRECGTYLEIHLSDTDYLGVPRDNSAVFSEAPVPEGLPSG